MGSKSGCNVRRTLRDRHWPTVRSPILGSHSKIAGVFGRLTFAGFAEQRVFRTPLSSAGSNASFFAKALIGQFGLKVADRGLRLLQRSLSHLFLPLYAS